MSFFNLVVILFLIMDPIGNISSSLSLLEGTPAKKRTWIIIREMLIALAVMIVFNFFGDFLFQILKVSDTTVRITSGVILFLIAIKILFPTTDSLRANLPEGEPFVTPLAIPLVAGPSLLATIMLFTNIEQSEFYMLSAIFLAWLAALGVLLVGKPLQRVLGTSGLTACERLMGMILVMLAIQRFLEGIQQFVKSCM